MRPSHVFSILDREFDAARAGRHTPVMLWGPPGVGKSQLVAQVAARHGVPLTDIRLSQLEPTDLRGVPFRNGGLVEWSVPAMLPAAARHGPRGILFLDEITSAPPTVSAAAYQLILDRRLGDYAVPEGWAIFAAGNRHGDRGVTWQMPAPLANRFTHYEVEPHLDDWVDWAHGAGIDPRVVGFLRFRPELLFEFDATRSLTAFPSPRTWEFAHRALAKFGDAPALVLDALQACVGVAAGVELKAFIDSLGRMPDIDGILEGRVTEVPERVDLEYGVAAALVRRGVQLKGDRRAPEAWGRILRYAGGFPHRELGVMLVADLQRSVGEPLYRLPEFADWAQALGDLVLFERGSGA